MHDDRPCSDALAVTNISNLQLEQVAGPQLTVDAKIEQRQFPRSPEDSMPFAAFLANAGSISICRLAIPALTMPGATTLTLIRCSPSSSAMQRATIAAAALEAQ